MYYIYMYIYIYTCTQIPTSPKRRKRLLPRGRPAEAAVVEEEDAAALGEVEVFGLFVYVVSVVDAYSLYVLLLYALLFMLIVFIRVIRLFIVENCSPERGRSPASETRRPWSRSTPAHASHVM